MMFISKNLKPADDSTLTCSELRYRRLFESAQDGILIPEGERGKILDANPFILDLPGYPLEYFVGKELWELGFIKDKSLAQKVFGDLKTHRYIWNEDIPLETKNSRRIDVEIISNIYPVAHRPVIQCNNRDIMERKQAQEAFALTRKKLQILSEHRYHDPRNRRVGPGSTVRDYGSG